MCTTSRSALVERMPRTSTGSAGVTKSVTSIFVPRRSAVVRSTEDPSAYDCVPAARGVVKPVRLAAALEPDAELSEMLAVVDVRPE